MARCHRCQCELDPGAETCPACGCLIAVAPVTEEVQIRNPRAGATCSMLGLLALLAFIVVITGALAAFDVVTWALAIVPALLFAFFFLVGSGVWLQGATHVRRIREFLASDRPIVRWTYSPGEWETVRTLRFNESKGDWKLQLGCASALFALIGLLTGGLIGLEQGAGEGLLGAIIGTAVGLAIGIGLGGSIALGSHLVLRRARANVHAEHVALGPHEYYANGEYFRREGRHRYIESVGFLPASTDGFIELLMVMWWPRGRGVKRQNLTILVPDRMRASLAAVLAQLGDRVRPEGQEPQDDDDIDAEDEADDSAARDDADEGTE
ncbi:MAG: hypothetical protein MUF51_04680 [Vicinamibacteria bacterium]|nr:hypothetical protein [Vicinamibacteria bacterium]